MNAAIFGDAKRILLAGAGGGYDVLGAIPVLADLEAEGREVHLASLSFTYLNGLDRARFIPEVGSLYEVGGDAAVETAYCPEAWLAAFLTERAQRPRSIWCFDKTGVRPLAHAYRWLVEHLGIDLIVLIDGGIDLILRGDETTLGTPSEDLTSLAAVSQLAIPTRIACLGLGAELRDGIPHEQVFARIAELTRAGGYFGAEAVVRGTPRGELYRDAMAHVVAHQQTRKQSHVHKVVLAAMDGEYGTIAPHVWLSALLPIHWWFDLATVARSHVFLDGLHATDSIWDVQARVEAARKTIAIRERTAIPI
jgi:hypothetical protein